MNKAKANNKKHQKNNGKNKEGLKNKSSRNQKFKQFENKNRNKNMNKKSTNIYSDSNNIDTKDCIEAIFIANQRGFGFAKPTVEIDDNTKDIFICKDDINGALDGDKVLVKIYDRKSFSIKEEGKIVKILERNKDTFVGVFEESRNFGFVVPDDKKMLTDIFIPKRYLSKVKGLKNNDKVIVKILKYPIGGKKAEGEIIENLGNVDKVGVDILSVVKELKLLNEFPDEIKKIAKKIPTKIEEAENNFKVKRKDLRKDIIFTIDGEDAKDLDDAISVRKTKNDTYLLDVHIADVSNYIEEDSLIDNEAIKRGTSVYLLDRVIPMLPVELSNGICSLNESVDRYALSCSMEIDKEGCVISSNIYKSIINVTKRMSYTDVFKIITNSDEEIVDKYSKYLSEFKTMEELANILKNRRIKEGYLNLDIPETKIILDEKGKILEIKKYENNFANEIIEQFMLIANETVAEKFNKINAPFIYRVHEKPDFEKIEETNRNIKIIGGHIKTDKENITSSSFANELEKFKGTEYEKLVSMLILRTLKVANYEETNKGHFGIASKYYCHFTSPIRRYPDLFIHRVISKFLENEYNIDEKELENLRKKAEKYSKKSSECEKNAVKAERLVKDMKKAEYMEDKIRK